MCYTLQEKFTSSTGISKMINFCDADQDDGFSSTHMYFHGAPGNPLTE